MYVCLDAYKRGFFGRMWAHDLCGCVFLKGDFGGQLHVVIGRDGNDDIFPIAFAVCESKTRET